MVIGHTIHGHGPEGVIVCHGWFGDSTVFGPVFPFLDTDAMTYAFVDYRGYGKSRTVPGRYTVDEIASDVLGLADSLGWNRFHIVGHSMGGKVVQRVALSAPKRLKCGIAITPVPASGVPFDDATWALFVGAPDNDGMRFGIVNHSVSGRLTPRWISLIVKASRETSTIEAYRGYLRSWAREDFSKEAKGLAVPIKVLIGEFDQALNSELMRQTFLAWYPNAELEVIGNSGHYPMQETPVILATVMEDFLRKHS